MLVPIILGSHSDKDFSEKITIQLDKWQIPYKTYIASAHKVPEKVLEIVQNYNQQDDNICYITIAGRSNGLSGVTAANSVHPVIACPPYKDKMDMFVNIHSSLQMPSDTPVITILDHKNVVMAIVRIFALTDDVLMSKLKTHLNEIKESFN